MSTGTTLNANQRTALRLLAERTDERSPDPGVLTSGSTFADNYNVWIHWRTAQALHRAGFVTYPHIDPDGTSIAITDAGRAAIEADR
jgi:hypothetical protein